MKIKLISDTHFEFYEDLDLYKNPNKADVLVIAGDLNVGHARCWSNLKRFAETHEHVIFTSGNHEYYRQDINEFDDYIRRFSAGTNIHFLNPGLVRLEDVTFIGAALWTNFGNSDHMMFTCVPNISDFQLINNFSGIRCVDLYNKHSAYIKQAYEQKEGKKVIVTHFLPDRSCIAEQYRGPNALNHYFANNLGNWIVDLQDTTWLYGHTHTPGEHTIGDTRVIANPYGYNRNEHYVEKLIEV